NSTRPLLGAFNSALNLGPFYWLGVAMAVLMLLASFSLRDSRLGRAWIAIREDEVAAASMGVPTVRTKLLSYATGAAMGGAAGAFLGFYVPAIDAKQFQFSFSILILSMIILGVPQRARAIDRPVVRDERGGQDQLLQHALRAVPAGRLDQRLQGLLHPARAARPDRCSGRVADVPEHSPFLDGERDRERDGGPP